MYTLLIVFRFGIDERYSRFYILVVLIGNTGKNIQVFIKKASFLPQHNSIVIDALKLCFKIGIKTLF